MNQDTSQALERLRKRQDDFDATTENCDSIIGQQFQLPEKTRDWLVAAGVAVEALIDAANGKALLAAHSHLDTLIVHTQDTLRKAIREARDNCQQEVGVPCADALRSLQSAIEPLNAARMCLRVPTELGMVSRAAAAHVFAGVNPLCDHCGKPAHHEYHDLDI